MFKSGVIAASALLTSQVQGMYVHGRCPKVESDWQTNNPGKHLDVSKISGDWHLAWESYIRQVHNDCGKIKLEKVEGAPSKLHYHYGISFSTDNVSIFHDNKVLDFSHPSDSSIAKVLTVEEL